VPSGKQGPDRFPSRCEQGEKKGREEVTRRIVKGKVSVQKTGKSSASGGRKKGRR